MESMSLMPSESAAFPDLVGWHHGYLPPHLVLSRSSPTRHEKQSTTQVSDPALAASARRNGRALPSDNNGGRAPTLIASTHQASPACPGEQSPDLSALNAEIMRLLKLAETRGRSPAGETTETDGSRLPHVALPPKQRSLKQPARQIQPQNLAQPLQRTRCRTPVRGLRLARRSLFVVEKTTRTSSSCLRQPTVSRPRLVRLRKLVLCETITVGVLVLSMAFGLSQQLQDSPFSSVLKVVAIAAAIATMTIVAVFLWQWRRSIDLIGDNSERPEIRPFEPICINR
jgi:hypothetical protein